MLFRRSDQELENAKLAHRLEKGRLVKEANTQAARNDILEAQIKSLTEERDYFRGLENDRVAIEKQKKANAMAAEDLDEDRKLYEHRVARLKSREERLEEDENAEYKKGYSDGLADGLRKAHDITREDRKYLTMIAMSTNQSEAIRTSQRALEGGFQDDNTNS